MQLVPLMARAWAPAASKGLFLSCTDQFPSQGDSHDQPVMDAAHILPSQGCMVTHRHTWGLTGTQGPPPARQEWQPHGKVMESQWSDVGLLCPVSTVMSLAPGRWPRAGGAGHLLLVAVVTQHVLQPGTHGGCCHVVPPRPTQLKGDKMGARPARSAPEVGFQPAEHPMFTLIWLLPQPTRTTLQQHRAALLVPLKACSCSSTNPSWLPLLLP